MTDQDAAPSAGLTRAGVTGKVPAIFKRAGKRKSGKAGKAVKLSADKRRHVRQLQKQGVISQRAAAQNGLAK